MHLISTAKFSKQSSRLVDRTTFAHLPVLFALLIYTIKGKIAISAEYMSHSYLDLILVTNCRVFVLPFQCQFS